MQNSAIFPLFYLPPINYFSALEAQQFIFTVEKQEHFPKQTHRNRATIASPNGSLDLIIPVIKGSKLHTHFKDVKISYEAKWQRLHWLSLQTCYRSSAYFEFYEDGLAPFYEKQFNFLFDYNLALLEWIIKQLKVSPSIAFTNEYETNYVDTLDLRNAFTKKNILVAETTPYFQVFSDRNPFIANLSILDLLFSKGPQVKSYI